MECVDALKRIDELEKENKNLKSRVKRLRFDLLPEDEKRGVRMTFEMLNPDDVELPFDGRWDSFKCQYIDYKDTQPIDELRFF